MLNANPKASADKLREFIVKLEVREVLTPVEAAALIDAMSWRGKSAGMLKSSCPPSNTLAAAAWQGAMLSANPYKASICSRLFFTPEQSAVADKITAIFDAVPALKMLDRDRRGLSAMGAW
jgi:hypothetical protein